MEEPKVKESDEIDVTQVKEQRVRCPYKGWQEHVIQPFQQEETHPGSVLLPSVMPSGNVWLL